MDTLSLFKCLSEPTRLYCALLIQQYQELCVCELMFALNESQPKVSRHLALLRESGLLTDRRQGQWVFYQLHHALPSWVGAILSAAAEHQSTEFQHYQQRLNTMSDRPERCC